MFFNALRASAMVVGGGSSPPPKLTAFRRLVATNGNMKPSQNQQTFVKKLDNIPLVDLPAEQPCHTTMNIIDQALIGQFTSLWPSPKAIDGWVQRNWKPLILEGIHNNLIGKGYYVFLFEDPEDKD